MESFGRAIRLGPMRKLLCWMALAALVYPTYGPLPFYPARPYVWGMSHPHKRLYAFAGVASSVNTLPQRSFWVAHTIKNGFRRSSF